TASKETVSTADVQGALSVNAPKVRRDPRDPTGGIVSEGYDITGAQTWHVAGYKGNGIRVAIVDVGFGDSGDPVNGNMACLADNGAITLEFGTRVTNDTVRGLEMLEVLCDVASSSKVRLYKVTTSDELNDGLQQAINDNNDVIVIGADFGPNISPGDGTLGYSSTKNPYARIQAARDAGIVVVSAAGNSRQSYVTFNYPSGSASMTVTAAPGTAVNLGWNDWDDNQNGGGPREDFSASLSGSGFATINKPARGSSNPGFQFIIPASCAASGGLCTTTLSISGLSGNASIVQVQAGGLDSTITNVTGVTPFLRSGTLARPSDSSDVITAGAICAVAVDNFPGLGYSSRGPVYLTGGNYNEIDTGPYTGNEVKPDVVGPAQVTTSFSSIADPLACTDGFGGSQAGAAHVAGQVAVLLSNDTIESFQNPGDPAQIMSNILTYLRTHAFDLPFGSNSNGYDMRFGAGVPVLGSATFNPDTLPNVNTFFTPNRIPEGECTAGVGGLVYVGPYDVGSSASNGSLTHPYTQLAYAIKMASDAGVGNCVIALPGEYSAPIQIEGLVNPVGVYAYASVIRSGGVPESSMHVHDSYKKDIGDFSHFAGIYVEDDGFHFGGFTFTMGTIFATAAVPNPGVLVTDSATDVLFSNNKIK
ncbi:MAG TPA: S8 family serine peptidase, partial [Phototrophicaceae bacterium]|nr:S8 family serine peptidase [Phototrophicaceae bacterium]